MPRKIRLLCLAVAAVALAGCGSSAGKPQSPFGQQEMPTTVAPPSPYAVPTTIDKEYLQRVVVRLEDVRASVRRDVLANKQYGDSEQKRLDAIYNEPALSAQSDLWRELAPVGDARFKPNPGAGKWTVNEIVTAQPNCVWLRATGDDSPNTLNNLKSNTSVDFVLKKRVHDESINPTPWVMTQQVPVSLQVVDGSRACG